MRRLVATGLLLLLVIGTAAACGGGGPSAAGPAGTVADPAAPANQFVGIEDVVAAGPTDLTIVTDPLPRAGATGACGPTVVTPRVEEHPTEVLVYVDYAGPVRSPFDRCDVATRTVTVPLAAPVGERTVRDAMGAQFWQRDGAWVGCGHVVMTCITTPASCQNLRDFVANADVPRHFGMGNTRCDGRWAIVDVDIGAGDCPVTGEPQWNPCAGVRVRRMYWQVVDDAWVLVGSDPGPGCGAIAAVAPAFPTSLCADLPVVATGGTGG